MGVRVPLVLPYQVVIMRLQKCPRCDTDWVNNSSILIQESGTIFETVICICSEVTYYPTTSHIVLSIDHGHDLWWDIRTKTCAYFHYVNGSDGPISSKTELPYLDFKVSRERLKLLLTFS